MANENMFQAKNGVWVQLRPLEVNDTLALIDIFQHMSSDSRYRRFHQVVDNTSEQRIWQEAERIAQGHPPEQWGLMALVQQSDEPALPIGAARYLRLNETDAEIAMSIRDDWQGLGIGRHLLVAVCQEAKEHGLQNLVASVQNNNTAVWHLLNYLPFPIERTMEDAISTVIIQL